MQNSAIAVRGRGLDLNDSFGNLGPFTTDATSLLRILNSQSRSLQGLVRDTGTVFEALSARDTDLADAITTSNVTFRALASRDRALAETIQIFPTFNEETRLTLNRLAEFSLNAEPLVEDLKPVADDLTPTFVAVRRLSPNLRRLFINLDPLLDVSAEGLPALRRTLDQLRPVLAALDPFLANLNPIIRYTNAFKHNVSDWMSSPPAGLAGTLNPVPGQPAPRHTLRQLSYLSTESLSVHPERIGTNRGNGYLQPLAITALTSARGGIFPNFDCNPSGEIPSSGGTQARAPCFVAEDYENTFGGGRTAAPPNGRSGARRQCRWRCRPTRSQRPGRRQVARRRPTRSQGDAHPELVHALGDVVADDGVEPDRGDDQGEATERDKQRGTNLPRSSLVTKDGVQGPRGDVRLARHDALQRSANGFHLGRWIATHA